MQKLSSEQKWKFAYALNKHGPNISKIKDEVDLDEQEIFKQLKFYRKKMAQKLSKESDPIDRWFDLIANCHQIDGTFTDQNPTAGTDGSSKPSENYLGILSKSMLYASCFETHYRGSSPDEPNYSEIYLYLSQLLSGDEPSQLRPGNANKVLEMLDKMRNILKDEALISKYLEYITKDHKTSYLIPGVDVWKIIDAKKAKTNTTEETVITLDDSVSDSVTLQSSPKEHNEIEDELSTDISGIPGFNPLEIEPSMLVTPFDL